MYIPESIEIVDFCIYMSSVVVYFSCIFLYLIFVCTKHEAAKEILLDSLSSDNKDTWHKMVLPLEFQS